MGDTGSHTRGGSTEPPRILMIHCDVFSVSWKLGYFIDGLLRATQHLSAVFNVWKCGRIMEQYMSNLGNDCKNVAAFIIPGRMLKARRRASQVSRASRMCFKKQFFQLQKPLAYSDRRHKNRTMTVWNRFADTRTYSSGVIRPETGGP